MLVCLLAPAADEGCKVEYAGGTLASLQGGQSGRLAAVSNTHCELRAGKGPLIQVAYANIEQIEYGQKAERRYVAAALISPFLLASKARRHYLTLHYRDDENQRQAMVLRVDKNGIRSLLASLEARTGLRVEFQDEEARKAGRG
jgi:hypothetical protein